MEKDSTNGNFFGEETEELTEILDEISKDINESKKIESIINQNDDFAGLLNKRDYYGHSADIPQSLNNKKNMPKRKLRKWVYVLLLVIIVGFIFGIYKIIDNKKLASKEEKDQELIMAIKSHYNKIVKVNKDTDLYLKEENEYQKIGAIYQNTELELSDIDITVNVKYFQIKNSDYYIDYRDVDKVDKQENKSRYKKYLPFNINILTKDSFSIYLNDEKIITLNKEMEFPVLINNYENKYYVEFNNQLVAINKDDVSKTLEHENTTAKNQSKITTLAYHRVYDTTDDCTDIYECLKKETFDKQMKYLSDNDYFTLTIDELYMYLKGNLQIEKGVVITIDDGYLFKDADEILDKYGLNGTMFVISGDFKDYKRFENLKALTIQSHTHKLHKDYVCAGGNQGGAILCTEKAKIIEDLKTSLESLKIKPIGLTFPFYDYNETAISALKEVGFKMSFVGRAGVMGRATPKVTDLYKIPRMTVWEESLMSFASWKSYL